MLNKSEESGHHYLISDVRGNGLSFSPFSIMFANNQRIEDLVDNEGYESPIAEVRRVMIRMFNKLKEDIKSNSMNPKTIWIKKLKKTQKQ
jgi:hypothetical protein